MAVFFPRLQKMFLSLQGNNMKKGSWAKHCLERNRPRKKKNMHLNIVKEITTRSGVSIGIWQSFPGHFMSITNFHFKQKKMYDCP